MEKHLLPTLIVAFALTGCPDDEIPTHCVPRTEVCNGLDDDCDNVVDEADSGGPLRRDCSNACGTGTEECEAGMWQYCTVPVPSDEVCDGADNDCDGWVDEVCECLHGSREPCGEAVGVCEAGLRRCENGVWSSCQLPYDPDDLVEFCNDGLDNDCDGSTDEGCTCVPYDTQPCGESEGECTPGVMTCGSDSQWIDGCAGEVGPEDEVCDFRDNDCDGFVDWATSIASGWEEDLGELNETCADALSVFNHDDPEAGGRAEINEGWTDLPVLVDDPYDITTHLTLYHENGDEDWYRILAVEAGGMCMPFTSQCFRITAKLELTDFTLMRSYDQDPEDYGVCLYVRDADEGGNTCDTSDERVFQSCTHNTDWNDLQGMFVLDHIFAGTCGGDNDLDIRIRVYSPTGAACGHYMLYLSYILDDTIDC